MTFGRVSLQKPQENQKYNFSSAKQENKSKNRKSKNYFLYKYFSCRLKSKQQNALRNY